MILTKQNGGRDIIIVSAYKWIVSNFIRSQERKPSLILNKMMLAMILKILGKIISISKLYMSQYSVKFILYATVNISYFRASNEQRCITLVVGGKVVCAYC